MVDLVGKTDYLIIRQSINSSFSLHWNNTMGDERRLNMAWADVPRNLRSDPKLLGDYAGYLQESGQDARAEKLLRDALHKNWDTDLVETYGLLELDEAGKHLQKSLEYWPGQRRASRRHLRRLARLRRDAKKGNDPR